VDKESQIRKNTISIDKVGPRAGYQSAINTSRWIDSRQSIHATSAYNIDLRTPEAKVTTFPIDKDNMTVEQTTHRKPRVVSLGRPAFVGQDYLEGFSKKFDFSVLEASNRAETKELLPLNIKENGPIDAFIIRMGTPPFEPFDEGLLGALAPDCRIITSASAGFNEFDVEWMTRAGMYFCNTVDAVAEATADMAIFLMLATLRNTANAEKSLKNGTWRGGLAPTRDPFNLTLGIVGMGAIGKVCQSKCCLLATHSDHVTVLCEKVLGVQHEDQVLQSGLAITKATLIKFN
jgi:hypothetical protein